MKITRRSAIKTTAAVSAGIWTSSQSQVRAESANEKLDIAVIGVGGQGRSNLNGVGSSQNIVALCDLDESRSGNAFENYPKAKKFKDFRRMFDDMSSQIDAVVISTPDHTHFHPAMIALGLGKHVYCEKPMAHSVWECRQMTDLAREKGVATQLGVQRHTIPNVHRVIELIQSGTIGEVKECHSWVGGDRGMPELPKSFPPVPAHLDWNLWLGPAKYRPYSPAYAPYKWRFWWDFGTGETGNWACHILDIPFWALGLTYPNRVDASGPEVDAQRTPKSMTTKMHFPTCRDGNPVDLHWYHAKSGPDILKKLGLSHKGNNTLFIGSKGKLLCGFGNRKVIMDGGHQTPDKFIPDSPGFHKEWIDACKGGPKATCNFDYSGPLSETALLGNTGYRAGGFDWDAKTLSAKGNDNAAQFIRTEYRKGWEWPNSDVKKVS